MCGNGKILRIPKNLLTQIKKFIVLKQRQQDLQFA